ncbi:hypothetical protein BDN70DRAFT_886116 [Pholiota conissans]|uniref:Uncharacterized protein n=1 Tax=Pholiota conissans TaxID=109636 RepID=A0A9P6CNS0_9AGAR|nr:hypothetical protein BDN70DRAFT_886116 [Pholiota conissans]
MDQRAEPEEYRLLSILSLLDAPPIPSDQIKQAFMNFDSIFLRQGINDDSPGWCVQILDLLKKLNFGDQGQAYQHVLDLFAEGLTNSWTSYDDDTKSHVRYCPDVCARICQLRPKLARLPSLDLSRKWVDGDDDDYISDESS